MFKYDVGELVITKYSRIIGIIFKRHGKNNHPYYSIFELKNNCIVQKDEDVLCLL